MKKIASVILGLFWLPAPVLFCLLVSLTIGFGTDRLTDENALYWFLIPVAVGVAVCILLLKYWLRNAYSSRWLWGALVYFFYSFIAVGLGMGVPLLNGFVSIAAGIYIAIKIHTLPVPSSQRKPIIKKGCLYTAIVMMALCALVGFWAIIGGMVGSRFELPFISFTFTIPIIILCVLTGGVIVSGIQYVLAFYSAHLTLRLLYREAGGDD